MSTQTGFVYRLTKDKVKEILKTRICPRDGKKFKEFSIRKKGNILYVTIMHYDEEKKKSYGHYLGVINDQELLAITGERDPQMRLYDILREEGATFNGWLMILDELKKDLAYLIVTDDDKRKLLEKLKEIENAINSS